MTDFKFRLESILKLRMTARDRCRESLAAAYRADQILKQQLEAMRQTIRQTQRMLRHLSNPGHINVDRLLETHRYELSLESQVAEMERKRSQVQDEIQRRRETLVEADREVRILEKLRNRKQLEHRQHEAKSEIRELDEVALRQGHPTREVYQP